MAWAIPSNCLAEGDRKLCFLVGFLDKWAAVVILTSCFGSAAHENQGLLRRLGSFLNLSVYTSVPKRHCVRLPLSVLSLSFFSWQIG